MRFALDGPTVTGRRTAAITAFRHPGAAGRRAARHPADRHWKQAANHAEALAAIFPEARLHVRGTSADSGILCRAPPRRRPRLVPLDGDAIPDAIDVVVTLTTSRTPVYREAAREADSWSASALPRTRRDRREHGARQPAGRRRSGRRTPRSRRPDRRAGRLAARRIARRRAGRRIRPRRAAAVQERRLCGVGSRRVPHGARCAGCAPGRLTRQPLQPRSRHRHRAVPAIPTRWNRPTTRRSGLHQLHPADFIFGGATRYCRHECQPVTRRAPGVSSITPSPSGSGSRCSSARSAVSPSSAKRKTAG